MSLIAAAQTQQVGGVAVVAGRRVRQTARAAAIEATASVGRGCTGTLVLMCSGNHVQAAEEAAFGVRDLVPSATIAAFGISTVAAPTANPSAGAAVCAMAMGPRAHLVDPEEHESTRQGDPASGSGGEKRPSRSAPLLWFGHDEVRGHEMLRTRGGAGCKLDASSTIAVASREGPVRATNSVALRFDGLRVATAAVAGVRFLGEPQSIDAIADGYVRRVAGRPAAQQLDLATAKWWAERPVVLALIEGEALPGGRVLRRIDVVDRYRGTIYVGADVQAGDRITFAIRDEQNVRAELDRVLRQVPRQAAGGVPIASLLLAAPLRRGRLTDPLRSETRALRENGPPGVSCAALRSIQPIARSESGARLSADAALFALLYAPS